MPEMLLEVLSQEEVKKSGDILHDMYVHFVINGKPKWFMSTKEQKYILRIDAEAHVEKLDKPDALMNFPEQVMRLS
ncbi:hypothetical protein AGR56_10180 [Clostridium sp. DMHC 10]|nr:hypothetical protein [Clostridium sp. DMHC 10]KOF56958.1 hypothetical protein AGR56_10180 [Clostridium sp. DMHC 10]